jgi:PhoH-like ATPase
MKKRFVLDTNVLMHDPASLFRFEDNEVLIPMVVLEELDAAKKGTTEVARSARQASRFFDGLLQGKSHTDIISGIDLPNGGKLFFQLSVPEQALPAVLPGNKADNHILQAALAGGILVTKDTNLRIKAAVVGVQSEDYHSDQTLDDLSLLPTGHAALPENFWQIFEQGLQSWQDKSGRYCYRLCQNEHSQGWHVNQFLYAEDGLEMTVQSVTDQHVDLRVLRDYRKSHVYGIHAKNREQNFALNLLLDPDIDFVSLLGAAGTGKTLLTVAAALQQSNEQSRYQEIIMTRVTVPLGEDIGFLPGTEEEKMTPWMGALLDNLEVLAGQHPQQSGWHQAAAQDLIGQRIKVRAINFMRGRTFLNRFIIVDEAQNLTPKQMKALVTRCGPGTKMVAMGNLSQIDTPYLSETTSGLTYVVDRFRGWPHGGHVTLAKGERSRLAGFASDVL